MKTTYTARARRQTAQRHAQIAPPLTCVLQTKCQVNQSRQKTLLGIRPGVNYPRGRQNRLAQPWEAPQATEKPLEPQVRDDKGWRGWQHALRIYQGLEGLEDSSYLMHDYNVVRYANKDVLDIDMPPFAQIKKYVDEVMRGCDRYPGIR